ncbi:MAG: DegT/DnrJ/EryC1/StrS aminotransferase family protein [Calditrichaeota bacterium]|nr:MAG: DegT/DnrJ/EryC1/StrS aminotransferase family protein [Calditrichota bacterium]
MITCTDDALAQKLRCLSLHGLSRDAWRRYSNQGSWYYEVVDRGYKYNMTDIAAALGVAQLEKVEPFWRRRAWIAKEYNRAFAEIPALKLPPVPAEGKHAWHLYLLQLRLEQLPFDRAEFINRLREMGVHCSVHFIPLHLMPYYRERYGFRGGEFPQAEALYQRVVSLPIYPAMTLKDVEYVIDAVNAVCH